MQISQQVIAEVVERIKNAAPDALRIILFGSYAREQAGPQSDLDIFVVESEVKARRKEMVRLSDAVRPMHIPVDIVVASEKNYQEWSTVPGTVFYQAANEGKVLYAA